MHQWKLKESKFQHFFFLGRVSTWNVWRQLPSILWLWKWKLLPPSNWEMPLPTWENRSQMWSWYESSTSWCPSNSWVIQRYNRHFYTKYVTSVNEHHTATPCHLALVWLIRVCSCYITSTQSQHSWLKTPCKYLMVI